MREVLAPAPRRSVAATIAVLLLLAGCGTAGEEAGTGDATTTVAGAEPSTTVGPSTSRAPAATATTAAPAQSALKRRDAPTDGAKAQFEYFQEGNGACYGLDESKPAAVVEFPKPEIAMDFVVCFPGFRHKQPVQADVRLPDGKVRTVSSTAFNSPEGVPYLFWTSVPGDPLGTYEVAATQGTLKGTGRFTVSAASTPRMVEIEPSRAPAGTTFRFGIAGFPPNSAIDLYLYAAEAGGGYRYLTKVPVTLDGQGQTIYSLPTARDDPTGSYCVLRRGPKASLDYFCALTFELT